MAKQILKVDEAIEVVINNLSSIQVPVGLMNPIAVPIINSVDLLEKCLKVLREPEPEEEPVKEELAIEEAAPDSEELPVHIV